MKRRGPFDAAAAAAGRQLLAWRTVTGLSPAELAKAAGMTADTVKRAEMGDGSKWWTLGQIARALAGVAPELGDADEMAASIVTIARCEQGPSLSAGSRLAKWAAKADVRGALRDRDARRFEEAVKTGDQVAVDAYVDRLLASPPPAASPWRRALEVYLGDAPERGGAT